MDFLDEKIASFKQSKRILKEEEIKQKEDSTIQEENNTNLSLEEIIECIKNEYLEIEDRKFDFKTVDYLDGKIRIPMVENYFQEVVKDSNAIALQNETEGVSFMCSYIKEKILTKTFDEFKRGMEQNFKDMELYLEWIEEGDIKKDDMVLEYGIFKTPTGKGYTYNLIFFMKDNTNTQLILGNFNCFYKDITVWENIIKGIINLVQINI
ncbi:hypothetical protein [Tepidibacter mesophilus]|uniref:hypothetical protein n=1 Tax=Tepidibacter mesophilus TaxID=655607 RepID=UPI000C0734AA|nr:hypothetical protein [Tepidibacter mesophilus]